MNNNYEDDSPEAYEKFCGNSSSYFKVKEWEVWKLEFANKEIDLWEGISFLILIDDKFKR